MINLSDVTLVAIDTVCHDLTALAIRDCCEHINFKDIVYFSDKYHPDIPKSNTYILQKPIKNIEDHDNYRWYGVPDLVKTSHMLIIEWDSWIINPDKWDDEFLNYDYIGAPWPWHKEFKVGNGGFSLRSKALMQFLKEHDNYKMIVHEDDTLCRVHRPELEKLGFTWASEAIAERFAFERSAPRQSFGFHGLFNFASVLKEPRKLRERMDAMNDYVRSKPEYSEFVKSLHAPKYT